MPAANTSCDPVPVPVVNEYEGVRSDVERIARQLHAQHQDEPVWDKLDGHKRDDYHLFAARVLQCPSVAAAFEARAKLAELQAPTSRGTDAHPGSSPSRPGEPRAPASRSSAPKASASRTATSARTAASGTSRTTTKPKPARTHGSFEARPPSEAPRL